MAEESHNHMGSPSLEAESRRTKIRPSGIKFSPDSHKVSAYITKKFEDLQSAQGLTWMLVDEETRNYYWEKFQEKYCWDLELDEDVKKTWNLLVAEQYNKTLCYWRKKPQPPQGVKSEVWEHWQSIWSTPEWKHKSECGKRNRYSEPAGLGTGISKHIGGSRSFVDHAIQLSADLKRKSTCWDLLKKTHGKKDGTFVDARSHAINEMMNARYDEASQPTIEDGVSQTPTTEAIDNMYKEVVGGVRKKRLYGIGSQAYVTFPDAMLGRAARATRRSSSTSVDAPAAAVATARVDAPVAAAVATARVDAPGAAAVATARVDAPAVAATVEAVFVTAEVAAVSSRCEALEKDNESLRQELGVLRQQIRHLMNIVHPSCSSSTPKSD